MRHFIAILFPAGDCDKARRAGGGRGDGGGAAELPQDEHLSRQLRPMVLAQAKVQQIINRPGVAGAVLQTAS